MVNCYCSLVWVSLLITVCFDHCIMRLTIKLFLSYFLWKRAFGHKWRGFFYWPDAVLTPNWHCQSTEAKWLYWPRAVFLHHQMLDRRDLAPLMLVLSIFLLSDIRDAPIRHWQRRVTIRRLSIDTTSYKNLTFLPCKIQKVADRDSCITNYSKTCFGWLSIR